MAQRKTRHAGRAEARSLGAHSECRQQRDGLKPRLGKQIVADPEAFKYGGVFSLLSEFQQLRYGCGAEHDALIGQ